MQRVGFLFNHDQIHQVAHSLPIALALARESPGMAITVATSNPQLSAEVRRLAGGALPPQIALVELAPRRGSRLRRLVEPVIPAAKLALYGDNLPFFRQFDALVVAEKTSLLLKTHYGLRDLRMIHTRHGAGDRAIGFDPASRRFDHVLASGRKIRDRLVAEAGTAPEAISIVGYPKFDIVPPSRRLPLQVNGRPTVLYNPHVSPHLSSWYRQGRAVLDYFRRNPDFNLIFAPHVMLFQRRYVVSIDQLRIARVGGLDPRLHDAPNIHIDLGSPASTDMTYTNAADIYLGDVSSQVYEFLRRPRPCVFLNAQGRRWQGDPNYAHWTAGEVVGDLPALDAALRRAADLHARFRPVQAELFAYSFDLTDAPSSTRAARAIAGVVDPTRAWAPAPLAERRPAAA